MNIKVKQVSSQTYNKMNKSENLEVVLEHNKMHCLKSHKILMAVV